MAWVNTTTDSNGNSTIGQKAAQGQASLGDRDSKRVVLKMQNAPAKLDLGSKATKSGRQGRG